MAFLHDLIDSRLVSKGRLCLYIHIIHTINIILNTVCYFIDEQRINHTNLFLSGLYKYIYAPISNATNLPSWMHTVKWRHSCKVQILSQKSFITLLTAMSKTSIRVCVAINRGSVIPWTLSRSDWVPKIRRNFQWWQIWDQVFASSCHLHQRNFPVCIEWNQIHSDKGASGRASSWAIRLSGHSADKCTIPTYKSGHSSPSSPSESVGRSSKEWIASAKHKLPSKWET